jgi:hypothetical protein
LFFARQLPRIVRRQPKHGDQSGVGSTTIQLTHVLDPSSTPLQVPASSTPTADPGPSPDADMDSAPTTTVKDEYVRLLAGDGLELQQRMRWLPGAKRPVIGLRWGVGLSLRMPSNQRSPAVNDRRDFERYTGTIGTGLFNLLQQRCRAGKFGDWPAASSQSLRDVVYVGEGSLDALQTKAKEQTLDVIAVVDISVRSRSDQILRLRVVDLHGYQTPIVSSPLSSRQAAGGAQLLEKTFEQIDAAYALRDMPRITAAVASSRATYLTRDEIADPLWSMTELRFYHTLRMIDDAAATACFTSILGPENGAAFVRGGGAERETILRTWVQPLRRN